MARDRKRAKQRQRRRSNDRQPARVADRAQAEPRSPEGDEAALDAQAAPPPLDESSAAVELTEAAMADPPAAELEADELPAGAEGSLPDEEDDDEPVGVAAARGASTPERTGADLPAEGNRFVNFLRACVAELRRVQWPDRRQVAQATGVVLGFVIIAGAYLGVLDAIFSRLIKLIL